MVPSGAISDRVLVYNKEYGQRIGQYGSRAVTPEPIWIAKLEAKNGFFTKLEESVLKEGFRNPIFCKSITEGTFSVYGTTRLWVAKKHNLEIPTVIEDHTRDWEHLELLNTAEDVLSKFTDKPLVNIDTLEMNIAGCRHHHLGET